MRLLKFGIHGFRGYKERKEISFENLTTLVGKNDAGKSSLMDALELFFSDDKLQSEDLCVSDGIETVELFAEFDRFPRSITIDDTAITNLEDEKLVLNTPDGPILKIVKLYQAGKTPNIFLEVHAPVIDEIEHPILLKQADLRKLGRDLGIEDGILGEDRNKNPPWRHAIFQNYRDAAVETKRVPISKEDAKKIWDKLKIHIPHFSLFKVDRISSDQDSEARDPLAAAARIAISEREEEINRIVERVQERATEIVARTIDKLREMSPELAVGLTPDISGHPKWDGFRTTLKTDGMVPFNKSGSGTKRLVLLNFFRAEAERIASEDGRGIIYAFEEPESSQHPQNQKLLLDAFSRIANLGNSQVILTTHSPLVAQNLPIASLRLISKNEALNAPEVHEAHETGVEEDALLERIAEQLGVLPDRRTAVLVMVEGTNDVNFFEKIFPAVQQLDPNVINLSTSPYVSIVPVGGADLKHWVAKRYLKGTGCVEYHIYDRDCGPDGDPKYEQAVREINEADDRNSGRLTRKRETENYLHPRVVREVFTLEVDFDDFDDVPRIVSEASKNTAMAPDMGEGTAKRLLNTKVASMMTGDDLREVDPDGEVLSWFREISQLVTDIRNGA